MTHADAIAHLKTLDVRLWSTTERETIGRESAPRVVPVPQARAIFAALVACAEAAMHAQEWGATTSSDRHLLAGKRDAALAALALAVEGAP